MNNFPLLYTAPTVVSYDWSLLWIVITGFVVAFFMAFTVGANDVANSFGPAVGSKVLTLKWACALAVIFESLGAVLLGTKMSDTIWKEMVDISIYRGQEKVLVFGYISSLLGATIWLTIATILKIPVSATHAVIAATVGFSLVEQGQQGIYWYRIGRIVASWFISPILAGTVSGALFVLVRRFILEADDPVKPALQAMPFFYGLTVFINITSMFMHGTIIPGFVERIPWWGVLFISATLGLITGVIVHLFFVPYQRRKIAIRTTAARMEENARGQLSVRYHIPLVSSEMTIPSQPNPVVHPIHSAPDILSAQVVGIGIPGRGMRRNPSTHSRRGSRRWRADSVSLHSVSAVERSEFLAETNELGEGHNTTSPEQPFEAVIDEVTEENDHKVAALRNATGPSPFPGSRRGSAKKRRTLSEGNDDTIIVEANSADACSACPYIHCPFKQRRNAISLAAPDVVRVRGRSIKDSKYRTIQLPTEEGAGVTVIFSFLQIVTAIFTAFGHGGNDVCNAIGPLGGIWTIFTNEMFLDQVRTPVWLLCFGALGMSCGLCILGRRVMETVGTTLSTVLPSSGFCIGLGTAFTVLISSEVGLPISTTHCIVGSVIFVGWLRSRTGVNWKLLWKIILGWAVTMPVAAGCSAAVMALFSLSL